MSGESSVDILFKEHSFEEIESVRDNLASEIDKRTDKLKSIVKEKYRDVVETSDAIQSMKLNLNKLEHSIKQLDESISKFYINIEETSQVVRTRQVNTLARANDSEQQQSSDKTIEQLLSMSSEIWDFFDAGNLKMTLSLHDKCTKFLNELRHKQHNQQESQLIDSLESKFKRDYEIIKDHIWHRIQTVEPNQIGIIAGSDEQDLYTLSLKLSVAYLADKLRRDISDMSYQAQIRRYEQYNYFNTTTNTIDPTITDMKSPPSIDYVQIPKAISTELSAFLFDTCRVINTIAGFSLSRSSIIDSLRTTLDSLLEVYTNLATEIDKLTGGSKRRRALQLYFDLMYLRVLLNTAKDLELIEELDSRISALMSRFELMLDTIELYIVSDALHTSVLQLSKSTIRLYGLLVPYLQ